MYIRHVPKEGVGSVNSELPTTMREGWGPKEVWVAMVRLLGVLGGTTGVEVGGFAGGAGPGATWGTSFGKMPQEDFPKGVEACSTELEALEFQRERASWAKGPREQATLDVGEGVRIGGRRVGSPTEGEAGEEDGAEARTEVRKERLLKDSPTDFDVGGNRVTEEKVGGVRGRREPK